MAWRMITSLDLHTSIPLGSPEPSHTKRRRSTGRKKSSKSESEQDVVISETVPEETGVEQVHRTASIQETEEVFVQNIEECETATVDTNGEVDGSLESTRVDDQETQEHQGNMSPTGDAGLWYRKHSSELTKSKKKKWRDKKKPADKSVEDSQGNPASQKEETATKKVSSPDKPAWSKPSVSSPPAASLKDIIEQEQSQASSDVSSVTEVLSPSKGTGDKHLPAQSLSTSPQGRAFRWNSGGRQSQKQRKRSKSNTLDESGGRRESSEGNTSDLADAGKEEKRPTAWGGVNKDPVPVQSLRDLIQEEEHKTSSPTPTPRIPVAPGKSGSTRRKLNWHSQPGFYTSSSDPDGEEAVDTDHERDSGVPLSPPKSAWKSNHIACSPPSSSVAFSTILESQEQENTNLNKFSRKPFHLTQLEEKAMEELLQYYGGKDNACEFVTVERIPSTAASPVWKKERSPSVTSN
ncbi:hypothetical protein OS493_009778 [Desmophyllum pertusum]|uniref:Uncharacterized protein n=1 Tax=Desmophyllum pertusum TaxID=174260 RepID=A0A9W9YRF2_9CNID|nr:hypothetical protein OS493_009778 [Desmophyllum pertusum]